MHACPKCKSGNIHRSRSRTRWETWRKSITGKRLFRCPSCGWRGWGVDLGPSFDDGERETAARALAPDPPNLEGTDFARAERDAAFDINSLDAGLSVDPPDETPNRPRRIK